MSIAAKSFEPAACCPLDGVRVIDMSRLVSGNMVSLQLADFGAEVIKIEDPKKGDPLRAWQTDGVSVHWKVYSRNKKSLALSLRKARGRELLLDLAATAQVLIENFRPGTLEAMGFGPENLHRHNPSLIIVRVSGWGQDGPYRDRPGFGTLVESMSGYAARTGFADREPALPPTALADMVAGLYGAMAVLVALREVEAKGGKGQVIDLPLLDPLFSFIATEAAIYRLTGEVRERTGSRSETTSPRNVFVPGTGAISASPPRSRRWPSGCFARSAARTCLPTRGFAPTPTGFAMPRPARRRLSLLSRRAPSPRTWQSLGAPRSPPHPSTTSTSSWPTRT